MACCRAYYYIITWLPIKRNLGPSAPCFFPVCLHMHTLNKPVFFGKRLAAPDSIFTALTSILTYHCYDSSDL